MSKRSEVLVSGCSFTATCEEAYGAWRFEKYNLPSEKVYLPKYTEWPKLLQENHNLNVKNISLSGASNLAICKKAQDYIIENHKKIKLVIIALSAWTRIQDLLYDTHGMEAWENKNNIISDLDSNDPKIIWFNLRLIYELQMICKQFNIKCVFFQMLEIGNLEKLLRDKNAKKEFCLKLIENPYFELINRECMMGWPFIDDLNGYDFWNKYLRENKDLQIGYSERAIAETRSGKYYISRNFNDPHPNQKGHQLIYEKVVEHLNEIKVI